MFKKIKISLLAMSVVYLCAYGCAEKPVTPKDEKTTTLKKMEVKLITPVKQKLVHVISQPGTLRANEETMIHAKVVGYASQVLVDIGAKVKGPIYESGGKLVKQGTKLLVVDVPEIIEEVQHKKALMEFAKVGVEIEKKQAEVAEAFQLSTEAGLVEARAGIQRAQASYDRWHSENKRISALVQSKVLDDQTRDEVLNLVKAAESTRDEIMAKVKHAEATVAKAKAETAKAKIAIASAESRLDVTKAELRKAETLAAYTTIYAPFDGVVTKRTVDPGKLVQDNSAPGTEPLFVISQIDPVRVVVEVPEIENAYVNPGEDATVTFHALPGKEYPCKVSRISWALDASSRNLRAEIDLPNPEGILRPGMFASIRIKAILPECFVLPLAAVVRSPEGAFGFKIADGKAQKIDLKIGRVEGEWVELLGTREAGTTQDWKPIDTKDEFISANVATISPGQPVITTPQPSK
ncbi:MAG: efflux RND transporter periplasmic adaptor subunit [Gemmataceae bacterium]